MKLMPHVLTPKKSVHDTPSGDGPIRPSGPTAPRGILKLLRLALGGAICGGFLGIFAGALLGILYGVWGSDISAGLDGALLGSAILAVLGAIYGLSRGGSA